MMYTTKCRGGPQGIQRTRHVHWSDNLPRGGAKNAIQDCTRHTVRPGPANPAQRGPEPDGARDPQTTPQCSSSMPFAWGAPLKDSNINATAKRSPTHRYAPERWDVNPIARVRPEHCQGEPAHCAERRANPHNPAARPPPCPDDVGRRAQKGGCREPDEPHTH